ncbi:MAG: DUF4349 domain-containing protein [Chloroflexota bacterium]|nr:DUF4349 domain-containing protein [Chloroflexota bacterium]
MRKLLLAISGVSLALGLVLGACSPSTTLPGPGGLAGEPGKTAPAPSPPFARPAATPAPRPMMPAPAAPRPPAGGDEAASSAGDMLDTAQRQVISTASLSLEVKAVEAAVSQVRAIAEGLGGFVERLSGSSGKNQDQATVTIRVPQDQFFTAVERLEALGKVQNRNMGTDDVTERFIDLEARLKSALRGEQSLLSLLQKAQTVSDVLTIERELSRVRSEIERLQGQLNFLKRRVDLATITVSLFSPSVVVGQPPSATLTMEVESVSRSVEAAKALVSAVKGKVDQVTVSVRDGEERATLSLRVFRRDFPQTLASVEALGKVRQKEMREGTPPKEGATASAEEPDAHMGVVFERERSFWERNSALVLGILVLAGLLGLMIYVFYWAGLKRGRVQR